MRNYLLNLWYVWDPLYYLFSRLKFVNDKKQYHTIFRVRIMRYRGLTVTLSDGAVIQKNDLMLKIHLHNAKIFREVNNIKNDVQKAIWIYKKIKEAMPELAQYLTNHHLEDHVKGIIGITTLYQGAGRLGFDVFPIKNIFYRIFKQNAFSLINFLAKKRLKIEPVYLFMSKKALTKQYLK